MQNIPSHTKEIRLMFVAGHSIKDVDINNDSIEVYKSDQIEIQPGIWQDARKISIGDNICIQEEDLSLSYKSVTNIYKEGNYIRFLLN